MSFPKTVAEIIAKARTRYADMTAAQGLDFFQQAWRLLADRANLRYYAQTITLTAGTRSYTIPADVIDVSSVYYQPSSDASTWIPMYPKSVDWLDVNRWGWRTNTAQQQPYEFCIETADDGDTSKAVLTLVQIPGTSSSGGYPCVGIFGQSVVDLTSGKSLPAFVNTDEYFVNSIRRQFALQSDSVNVQFWKTEEEAALGRLCIHIKQMTAHQGTSIVGAQALRQSCAR